LRRAFLALGANLGDREAQLRQALRLLEERCRIVAVSSLYASDALVPEGAAPGPEFFNAVCEIETDRSPPELLTFVQDIERAIGRQPAERWAARLIDIDILLLGDAVIDTPALTVPHASMHARDFVLVPLAEIAPGAVHPVLHETMRDLANALGPGSVRRVRGPEWASGAAR
jgi:2-amino-4-hydroxy-6-hydroxymethyldihydropteridine diphosphokinase